ncbi:MAG: biopolymer transporter ExbD [Anaeromyxobacter sp.]|nr:biopolymer transporter ExbD [Anaeromyxobacter sp.]
MAGGGYDAGEGEELIGGVNTTPLVDVTLTLLIVFIVTASFVVDRTMPVQLPTAASAEATPPSLLTIAIAASGEVYLNGAPGRLEDIQLAVDAARARAGGAPDVKLAGFVSADVAAPYGKFAEAVDRLRLAGVTEIALDTQPATP